MAKDLRIAMQLAAGAGQPLHMGERTLNLYRQVLDASPEPVDFSAIYEHVYHGKPAAKGGAAGGGGNGNGGGGGG